ncbi:MAG: hypothetical protein PGN29_13210 [Gordonia paraffinivorans]
MPQLTAFGLAEAMAHSAATLDVKNFGAYEFSPTSLPQDIELYAAVGALRNTSTESRAEMDVRIELTRPDGSTDPDRHVFELVASWDGPGADRALQPTVFPVALPVTLDQPGTWRVSVGLDDEAPTLAAAFFVVEP